MTLFEQRALLGIEERDQFGPVEDLGFGDLCRVHPLDFRDLRLLLLTERAFLDAGFGVLAAQSFHGELVRALRGFIRHTGIVDLTEEQVYERIGEEGFSRVVRAFYAQVPGDDILGPMYPAHDLAGAEQRLRDFLIGRFGGPPRYIEQRGHPRLRMRHMPFSIDQRARDRWMQLMSRAIDESHLPPDVAALMHDFLSQVATFMINRPDR